MDKMAVLREALRYRHGEIDLHGRQWVHTIIDGNPSLAVVKETVDASMGKVYRQYQKVYLCIEFEREDKSVWQGKKNIIDSFQVADHINIKEVIFIQGRLFIRYDLVPVDYDGNRLEPIEEAREISITQEACSEWYPGLWKVR